MSFAIEADDWCSDSVGEHTSVNHAWIFSALESATRGVVQLLLEDGLVDEAKEVSCRRRHCCGVLTVSVADRQ
jgi:hypothetical protein